MGLYAPQQYVAPMTSSRATSTGSRSLRGVFFVALMAGGAWHNQVKYLGVTCVQKGSAGGVTNAYQFMLRKWRKFIACLRSD